MPMTTFLNSNETEQMRSVSDKDVDQYFQEVRNKVSNKYLLREYKTEQRVGWFKRRVKEYTTYSLYIDLDNEYQVMNFACDINRCPSLIHIHTIVGRDVIIAYFLGVLGGFNEYSRRGKLGFDKKD